MLLWIESQPTPIIGVLLFALCYGLAGMVFFAVFSRSTFLRDHLSPAHAGLSFCSPCDATPVDYSQNKLSRKKCSK